MRNIIYVGSVVVISAQMAMAQAYKWVDEHGVIHFSDKPHTNAEIIYLDKTSPQTTPEVESTRLDENLEQISTKVQPATRWYESIEIVSPSPEETLWNLEGVLHVALFVTPTLQKQDRIRVYFDGEEELTTSSLSFEVHEVWRGTHNIQVEIIDATGRMITRSPPSRFYVQQNRIVVPPR